MRYVVITGVSRGLGEALLNQLLAEPDTTVLALGRTFTDNQRMLAGPKLILRHCELAEPSSLPTAPELGELIADADEVVLIHNAAVVAPIGAVGTLPTDELLASVTINLTAPMALTNSLLSALPPLVRRVRLMFVSSGAAHRVIDGWSAYSATKRGGEEFFAHVAQQYERDPRFSVVSVNPGVMDTGMQEAIRGADFAGRQRFQDLYDNDELPDPAAVAAHLIAEHLKA
ncbi:short-chain dehydrogenase [Catellatospora sp. TT07R-123]|uniref:SDR family NAD(P)-dependent oxidoreductase n=1 Tax=Catellatospora sp. TT07R-123 TaxID=2733863 RepID=UPI001B15D12A|nr:SDR family NAD(P)-dependent oxidoreductase [Catellatospora sp. TT07R-123]GHJ49992.1 short-chain dehydrogenase [Catellatospora sp. TT07R-123]